MKTEKARIQVIIDGGDVAGHSIKNLTAASRSLYAQIQKTEDPVAREELAKKYRKIKDEISRIKGEVLGVDAAIKKMDSSVAKSGGSWGNIKSIVAGVFGGNLLANGIQRITSFIPQLIEKNAALASSLANVRKTTGFTSDQVNKLYSDLKKLDTPTKDSVLLQYATEAGKLGKDSVEDVKRFVEQADKITVALGEDLGEGAITDIGKLSNIFGKEMINIASAINEVGAASEASEAWQVDFLKRMSGTAPTVHIAAEEVLGYGAALEAMGQTQEVSGTALNTFLLDFVRNAEEFGKITGFARGELKGLLEEKGTNEAFLAFLEKLKSGSESSEEMLNKLKALGVDGARGANVLLTLANSTGRVREQQLIASNAIQNGNSILKENEIRNNNLAGAWDKLGKKMASVWTNSTIKGWLESIIVSLADARTNAEKLGDEFEAQQAKSSILDNKLKPLLQRYDELKSKGNLNKIEQAELRTVIENIASIVPAAITQVDKYGKALDINKSRVIQYADAQRVLARTMNAEAIQQYNKEISDTQKQIDKMVTGINRSFSQYHSLQEEYKRKGQFSFMDKDGVFLAKIGESAKVVQQEIDELRQKMSDLVVTRASLMGEDITKFIKTSAPKSTGDPDPIVGGGSLTDDEKKAYIKNTEDFLADLAKVKADSIANDEERDIAAAAARRDNRKKEINSSVADAKVKADLLKALDEQYEADVDDIKSKYSKKRSQQEYTDAITASKDLYVGRQALLLEQLSLGEISEKEYNERSRELTKESLQDELKINEEYSDKLTQAEKDAIQTKLQLIREGLEEEQRIRDENNRKILAQKELDILATEVGTTARLDAEIDYLTEKMRIELENTEITEEEKKLIRERYQKDLEEMELNSAVERGQQYLSIYQNITGAAMQIKANQENHALDLERKRLDELTKEDKKALDRQKASLKAQLDKKLISQEQYEAAVNSLEEGYSAKSEKREEDYQSKVRQVRTSQFVRDKIAKIIEATMNTALAVTAMLKYGPLAAVATGIAGGAQIATIASTKTPVFRKGGIPPGPSHEAGGIDMIDSMTGQKVGEMEGGEPYMILSRNTYSNNRRIIDALLDSSLNRNGAPILPNFTAMSAGAAYMKTGGIFTSTPEKSADPVNMTPVHLEIKRLNNSIIVLGETVEALSAQVESGIEAKIVYHNLTDAVKQARAIKRKSSSGVFKRADGFAANFVVYLKDDFMG